VASVMPITRDDGEPSSSPPNDERVGEIAEAGGDDLLTTKDDSAPSPLPDGRDVVASRAPRTSGFDYADIGDAAIVARLKEDAEYVRRTGTDAGLDIGRTLLVVKDLIQPGQFTRWVRSECRIQKRTAENMMAAARFAARFGEAKTFSLPLSVMYLLANAKDQEVEKVLAAFTSDNPPSVREVKGMLGITAPPQTNTTPPPPRKSSNQKRDDKADAFANDLAELKAGELAEKAAAVIRTVADNPWGTLDRPQRANVGKHVIELAARLMAAADTDVRMEFADKLKQAMRQCGC